MNPVVLKFLQKSKEEQLKKRNKHLVSLGLIDKSKVTRIYFDNGSVNDKFDKEKQRHYMEEYVALNVTDEEYKEICKFHPEPQINNVSLIQKDLSTIKKLLVFFTWVWVIGVAVCVIAISASI